MLRPDGIDRVGPLLVAAAARQAQDVASHRDQIARLQADIDALAAAIRSVAAGAPERDWAVQARIDAMKDDVARLSAGVADALSRLPLKGERGPEGPPGPPGKDALGLPGRDGRDGADGRDGIGVAEAQMAGGDLVITLTDGTEQRIGRVRGADGKDGPRGPAGPTGRVAVTVSDQAPSSLDGEDGDVWFQV